MTGTASETDFKKEMEMEQLIFRRASEQFWYQYDPDPVKRMRMVMPLAVCAELLGKYTQVPDAPYVQVLCFDTCPKGGHHLKVRLATRREILQVCRELNLSPHTASSRHITEGFWVTIVGQRCSGTECVFERVYRKINQLGATMGRSVYLRLLPFKREAISA